MDNSPRPDELPRLFAAVSLPAEARAGLERLSGKLRPRLPFQKWTHPSDIHITLKFVGETPEPRVDAVKMALRQAAEAAAPFELAIAGLGVFGPPARPTILWAGVTGDRSPLQALQRRVEAAAALAALGYEREARPFRPHVTLARRYSGDTPFPRAELERLAAQPLEGGPLRWTVEVVTLYRSHLGRTPMYEALAEFNLAPQ